MFVTNFQPYLSGQSGSNLKLFIIVPEQGLGYPTGSLFRKYVFWLICDVYHYCTSAFRGYILRASMPYSCPPEYVGDYMVGDYMAYWHEVHTL